jgi:ADP-L-glycero-D-manno-heptose 6-epimerase
MIALTGAGGFIGSVVLGYLNSLGYEDIYIFDDLPLDDQYKNLIGKTYSAIHSTREIVQDAKGFQAVIHCGANSNTLERDWNSLYQTNVLSTRRWWEVCQDNDIPMIFTSSAAVYGNGQGPLNQYAFSKHASEQELKGAVILRLFNVYGPNEYHKGRMASTPYHWFNQLRETGKLKLFNNSGDSFRDFIYVEDVARIIHHFLNNPKPGVYDVGTGSARSFEELADALLSDVVGSKEYFEMPKDLTQQYQTHTKANLTKLVDAGFNVDSIRSIDSGLSEYVSYLKDSSRY